MKRLILSTIPDDFDPSNDILLGPWCFLGKEKQYPEWDLFSFEPDPFKSPEEIVQASRVSIGYANSLMPDLANELNSKNNLCYSEKFWRLLIFPWLFHLVQSTYERQCRIDQFSKLYSQEKVYVKLFPNTYHWNFIDSLDFLHNGIYNSQYNYWLFSRIIEEETSSLWKIEYESSAQIYKNKNSSLIKTENNPIGLIRRLTIKRLFPSLRCHGVYGFGKIQSILFSFLLNFKKATKYNYCNINKYQSYKKIEWNIDFKKIINATIPSCFLNLGELDLPNIRTKKDNIRLLGPIIHWDENKKLFLGLCLEKDEKFILTQHGGLYGTSKVTPFFSEVDNKHYSFFSWGWKEQEDYYGKIIPLPSPYLLKFVNKYNPQSNKLILVSKIAYLFCCRIEAGPQPKEQIECRRSKVVFLKSLNQDVFNNLLYRPSFSDIASLSDESYFENKFPGIPICYGDLHPHILKCKLMVLDHPGTTLNISMAANIPVVCFWDKQQWDMCKQAVPYFNKLEQVEVLFYNPKSAAKKVNDIWNDVQAWWNQRSIQEARKNWCHQYARTNKFWWLEWMKALWKL